MTGIGTTHCFTFCFRFPLHLVIFNPLFLFWSFGFWWCKNIPQTLCCQFFALEKHVFKMLGIKLNAYVLASLLLSHRCCLLFLRTWPSPPQWIRKNLSNPPSSLAVQFDFPLLFTRQQLFPPKAQKKPASHKWQLKSEALSKAVWDSVKEKLYIVILLRSLGSCVSHQFQRTERRYVQVTNTRNCTNQYIYWSIYTQWSTAFRNLHSEWMMDIETQTSIRGAGR